MLYTCILTELLKLTFPVDQRRLQFEVIESFCGVSPSELTLQKYDIVTVIENNTSGWSFVCEPSAGSGWFPTSYLEPLIFPKKAARVSVKIITTHIKSSLSQFVFRMAILSNSCNILNPTIRTGPDWI